MTTLSKKYIDLSNRLQAAEDKHSRFIGFIHYDPKRAETWLKRTKKIYAQIDDLEGKLTKQDKEAIEVYYQCEIFV